MTMLVFAAVRHTTGIDPVRLSDDERHKDVLYARYIAVALLYENGLTMEEIAAALNRTRQGVSRAIRAHEQLFSSSYLYRNNYHFTKLVASLPQTPHQTLPLFPFNTI